jgi:hypothetical protein
MKKWEIFEIKCTNFLNEKYGTYAEFIHQGKSNSKASDILVKTKSGKSFYMGVKLCPAQCGQFVLLPNLNTRRFEYSSSNDNPINRHSEMIINYMNDNFDVFSAPSTSGKSIDIPNGANIFSNWVIEIYQHKGAKLFITNNYTILPIEYFRDYFQISAKYRIKRSGSSSVGKHNIELIKDYISTHDYAITNYRIDNNKLFVTSVQQLHNQRFTLNGITYMFSLRTNEYELRKLSKTNNPNVIFSIVNKTPQTPSMPELKFIDYLK